MKSVFNGSAVIAATFLASSLFLTAKSSIAETLLSPFQQPKQELSQVSKPDPKGPSAASDTAEETKPAGESASKTAGSAVVAVASDPAGAVANNSNAAVPAAPAATYTATAYSLGGRTASGRRASKGLIAADPRVLPLGTRVHVEAGVYSGEYLVADTGGMVRGKRIDIWTPSGREASRFGRRLIKLTVLSYGPKHTSTRRRKK